MNAERSIRKTGTAVVVLAGLMVFSAGCQNNEIPLVQFPNGPPPPPPPAKVDPNSLNKFTSQGDPTVYSK